MQFDDGAKWTISGNSGTSGLGTIEIAGFTVNDTIDLTGFVATSKAFVDDTLVLTDAGDDQATLHIQGSFNTNDFQLDTSSGTSTDISVLCFVKGTQIATPAGEVSVERLSIGDTVLTRGGKVKPIVWIGTGRVLAARGRRSAATPVIIQKGALAENVPHRDLHITKAHSLYIDDVFIPVEFLVNHRSIMWDDHAQEVSLYHIELETHDVLLANGAPTESYRDDGNRWLFHNANSGWGLPPQEPCVPVLTGGPVVDAIWRRLLECAGPRKGLPLTEDEDLHLLADGRRLDAVERVGDVHVFRLCTLPSCLNIVSRAAVPAELGLARDPRLLGVGLRRLVIRKGSLFWVTEANDNRLREGFHEFEPGNGFRWTDGNATIPAELYVGFTAPLELIVHVGATASYPADDATRRVA
ncbi:Hint domain-containing protein [Acidisphaera sp. S103]|uniref:Hint domain-containing protein n=1 Tax=Acidisphaera sp. S103 TaxID=1747223 RepID=UPI00131B94AB|nr:Hint domain-containing protein [Acidisphaera sp. S103]